MAIEKNNIRAGFRFDSEFSMVSTSREIMSSDEDELHRGNSIGSEDDGEFDDADSGAGSDDCDLLELGETGSEFCQVGDQTCSIPFELYDLPDLHGILSLDVWNNCLTEEERLGLTKYLPDMDQETFMITLKELFEGCSFHFGSPITKLYEMLKGGLCEPRVALYRQGLNFFQKHQHYHLLRRHQDSMAGSLLQMREAWLNCKGYSIEEKLRVLNIMRSQKSLMGERNEDMGSHSSEREESGEALWSKRSKGRSASSDIFSRGNLVAVDHAKYGKQNPKGLLKMGGSKTPSQNELAPRVPSRRQGYQSIKTGVHGSDLIRDASGDDELETIHGIASRGDWNAVHGNLMDMDRSVRSRKKREGVRCDEYDGQGYSSMHLSARNDFPGHGRNMNISQLSDIQLLTGKASNRRVLYDSAKKAKYVETSYDDQMRPDKGQASQMAFKGNLADFDTPLFDYGDRDVSTRKLKMGREFPNSRLKEALQASRHQMDDRIYHPEKRTKLSQENFRGISVQNGGSRMIPLKGGRMFHGGEETESDSSDQSEEEDDNSPLIMTKLALHGRLKNSRSSQPRPVFDQKKEKRAKKDVVKESALDEILPASSTMGDFGRHPQMPEIETFSSKSRKKSKTLHNFASRVPEDVYYGGLGNSIVEGDRKSTSTHKLGKNGQVQGMLSGSFPMPMNKFSRDFSRQSKYLQDYTMEADGGLFEANPMGESVRDMDPTLIGCTISVKNLKGKEGSPDSGSSELPMAEARMADLELEVKPQKKSFTLITPTIHSGFSFSIVHLLSAVRMALVNPNTEDSLEVKHEPTNGILEQLDVNNPGNLEQTNVPSLTLQEIVNRVRSNPGDPCILETQEPLQDLVRGVLKIFSSKTAPLGAKGWKPLVCFEKSTKCWSWTGPIPQSSTDNETLEEVTSPDAWRVPHKMLVKLVDSFANWLKSGQETLQQIGSLPAPPLELMQLNFDEKERFRDLRAQKSLTTISPSSDEVRAYFRKEEQLRYSIPDRAFSYTAADGKKSIVAPLRRCGGKPTSKARDHFMLKRDRPPHVTILCLVRDAASRLPGSIGTRADVCTLIRDSQYIVEDVSDAQVNQVVSGALDRLHYERDPCVQFDGERKLWVYLHREREEEDFEDDGTSSTKKWKRQKKDVSEQDDQVTLACPGTGEPSGFDLSSDLNVEPPCLNNGNILEVVCDDTRQRTEDFQQMLGS